MNKAEKRRQKKLALKETKPVQQVLACALQHHAAGQLFEAEKLYHQVLQENPEQPEALRLLGVLARQMGKCDLAVAFITKSLGLNPDCAEAHNNLGNALGDLGKLDEAVACFHTAVILKPDYEDAHNNLGVMLKSLGKLDEAAESYLKAILYKPDYAEAYNNLGNVLQDQGKITEAEESYHKAITFKPDFAVAYQNRANVLKTMGHHDETVACLQKALELAPELSSSRHVLNAFLGKTTERAPMEYVVDLFDTYAHRFENELVNKLDYQIPARLKKTLVDMPLAQEKFGTVVDLGCGTGLVGEAFRENAHTLIGIDLSKNMVRQAEAKGVYDQLYVDDLVHGLSRYNGNIDLFVCADVFIYVGDLAATFAAIQKSAAPNAMFLFSTEHTEETDTFVLQDTVRYAHAQTYIEALALKFGFTVEHFESTNIRKDKSDWVAGVIYLLKC